MIKYLRHPVIIIGVAYLLLLILSNLVQYYFPALESENRYHKEINVEIEPSVQFSLVYYELANNDGNKKFPLILFPDVYYGSDFLLPVAEQLAENYRVIIPVYQKIIRNEIDFYDHTINSKVRIATHLLTALDIDKAHIAGQGYGGAIAIKFADQNKDKTQSLSLLSGIGVQELNYLGNYTLNKLLFSTLPTITWILEHAFPHFGWFYNQPVQSYFAKSLVELDLREHRQILQELNIPVMVIHSSDDRYVPVQMANEHYRIIPQSSVAVLEGFHKSIFERPAIWANELISFLNKVENNNATNKTNAADDRIASANEPFDSSEVVRFTGWIYFFILLLIAFSSIINEDIAGIGGGLLAARGLIGFWDALFACMAGVILFDIIIYWLGRLLGSRVLRRIPFKWFLQEEDIQKAEKLFDARGLEILFAAKFIPGTRFPTYFSAGMLRNHFFYFLVYFITSVILWAPIVVGLSMIAGQTILTFFQNYQDYFAIIAIAGGIFIYLIIKFLLPVFTVKGRRKLAEKLDRDW